MPRTLQDDIKADLAATFLNADEFGESATYLPSAGGEVSLTISVQHTGQRDDGSYQDADVDELQILLARDPSLDCGGIANPGKGDRLVRSDGVPYGFDRIQSSRPESWVLIFRRRKPAAAGPGTLR